MPANDDLGIALDATADQAVLYAAERGRQDRAHKARLAVRREALVELLDHWCALRARARAP